MRAYKAYAFNMVLDYAKNAWGMEPGDYLRQHNVRGDPGRVALWALPCNRERFDGESDDDVRMRVEHMWVDIFGYADTMGFNMSDMLEGICGQVLAPVNMAYYHHYLLLTDDTVDGEAYWWPEYPMTFRTKLLPDPRLMAGWSYLIDFPSVEIPRHEILPSHFIEVFLHEARGIEFRLEPQGTDYVTTPTGYRLTGKGLPFAFKGYDGRYATGAHRVLIEAVGELIKLEKMGLVNLDGMCGKVRKNLWPKYAPSEYASYDVQEHLKECKRCKPNWVVKEEST